MPIRLPESQPPIAVNHIRRTDEYCLLDDKGRKIHVSITNGLLTISGKDNYKKEFIFIGSSPSMVKAIGRLLVEAGEIKEMENKYAL